jgi:hypothetical protein
MTEATEGGAALHVNAVVLHDAQIQVAGDANVERACMAAENVDVAAGHSKMLGGQKDCGQKQESLRVE